MSDVMISLGDVFQLGGALIAVFGVYMRLGSRITVLEVKCDKLEESVVAIRDHLKAIHSKIDDIIKRES